MTTRDDIVARLTAPGQPFEIGIEDVLGQPLPVYTRRHRSLGELLHASAKFGNRDYLVTRESRLTFEEHRCRVAALAAALRTEYDVRPGDRVAICAANSPEWIVTFWAAVSLGAVAVGMNSLWTGPEMAHALELTEPKVLVADRIRMDRVGDSGVPTLSVETDLDPIFAAHATDRLPDHVAAEDDPAVILFTSGTTGHPKGATHSHRNVLTALWFHLLNDAVATELGAAPANRRFLLATPLFHIAALHNLAVVRLVVGDTAVIHQGRFDADTVLGLIEQERVTNWGAVPTMLSRILEGDLSRYDLSSLRTVTVNSAPSSQALREKLRAALPEAGRSLGTSYGMTESSTAATIASPAELLADPATVGRPILTMQVEVRDADGNRVPDGVEGEICLRGPGIMLGYWKNPEATEQATAPHGWYRTGDLGTMDGEYLSVSSRRSDLILRGGENVYPAEIENRLALHPEIRECVVLGVDHDDLGQEVAAIVVVSDRSTVTEAELTEFTGAALARYKVPTRWTLSTEDLPRNATGKVIRAQVESRV
ncbi:acyl-CoA synthetase (AMP-forming)/AMP-acid ligase II [Rhodococcus sp. AG1013]|uniref:class I adenylate-forming enzyme family protein n=1 Tax=Rhodococcus sp. AG1013 TaxID=2183996 RepID=UPI000E0B3BA6|nr:AMP-binding protein [Rhodococcus sp. AG1013]RDI24869.1 acyl-CoA synthetase (AMP-forming)/AMP-acid ligase II [Rhodococcus sp. AG1013]